MFACHRVDVSVFGCTRAGALAALALSAGVVAAQEYAAAAIEQGSSTPAVGRPLLELSSSEVPRFDETSTRASRTNLTLFPARRSLLGLSVGVTSASGTPTLLLNSNIPSTPMLDLGLHWRHEMDRNYRLDITAWHRVGNLDAMSLIQSRDYNYGARVEMGLASGKGARSGFVADRGFVGVQLDGGARVTVKRSGGRPMLYYRNNF